MVNELKVKCFMCLAETLSFTEAGRRLFISQQAVSRHIAGLEQDLGIRLFERSRNSVELTEAGVRFFQFFRETGSRLQLLLAELAGEYAIQTKNIRIGYQNWLEFGPALGSAMAVLRESTPDLHLLGERHSPVALITLLESAKLDMILIHERFIPINSELRRLLLIKTPMQVVISRRDPLCIGFNGDYHIFESRPLLIDAFEGENQIATVARAGNELAPYKFEPKEIIVLPNRDSIYTEAELGRGIFLSSSMSQTIQNGSLARFDTDVLEGLFCVWRTSNSTFYIEQYAKQLRREYSALTERFLKTYRWE
ncbi:DNA-binding transcriptional regulator, LysR family [Sporobacter termitidis DSM 10068]|uniref:DNA-binding transcriptional regulator, LysR family n=1 Tax=Sporobacter termitidis DSM 10068 TaxID=1123282 RepID=A0A1M5XW23_9FIRM|nr:LysR family transcriptional regulator [Sporobacter termitidis]SHI03946.1 DNA-binding transcriptional regulator, LysR family [Sporobacter termitidis DSM 10068]